MVVSRWVLAWAVVVAMADVGRAQDPLQLVPAETELIVKVNDPRRLAEAVYRHEVVQEWYKIDGVRELFDTTNTRRLLQLLAHYEKHLGVPGPEMFDGVAGNGIVLAARVSSAPALLVVVQGKDESLVERFMQLTTTIAEQEIARQEIKEKLEPRKFGNASGYRIGKACIARAGATIFFANEPAAIEAAVSLMGKNKGRSILDEPAFVAAKGSIAPRALGWTWLHLEGLRKIQAFKAGLDALSLDLNAQVLFGGLVHVVRSAKFLVANFEQDGKNFALEVRMPSGRDGMEAKAALYVPTDDKGSLPLLKPPRTLTSVSYFFDLKGLWDNRQKLLAAQQLKGLEGFDANSGRFLGGTKLSTLFAQAGPHQRVVVALPAQSPYKIKPQQAIPSFALVQEMRDPAFAKSMNTVLRSAGILASFTYNIRLREEKRGEHNLIAYYFPEDKKVPGDEKNVRFNFSPCFVTVGDQLIVSSTVELARDLVDQLDSSRKSESAGRETTRIVLSAQGGAQALRDNRDQLLAQAILNQALPPAAARKQIESFIDLVQRLGELRLDVRYEAKEFRYTARWQYR